MLCFNGIATLFEIILSDGISKFSTIAIDTSHLGSPASGGTIGASHETRKASGNIGNSE